MSIEIEIAIAWQSVWQNGIPVNGLAPGAPSPNPIPGMNGLVPGKLHTDEVTEGQAVPDDPRRLSPYAILTIKRASAPRFRHFGWLDFRTVTVEVYGKEQTKISMDPVANALHALFDRKTGYKGQLTQIAALNPNAIHAWSEYDEEDEKPDQARKVHGRHPRLLTMSWLVVTNRKSNHP